MASRGKNFSEREKCKLLELVQKYKHIIENKCTNAISVVKKNEAWEVITQEFNSSGEVLRTSKQLITAYLNLKRTTRQNVANENVRKYIEQKNSSQNNAGSSSQTTTTLIDEPSTHQQIVEINSLLKKLKNDETADKKGVMATGGGIYQPILSNVGAQVLAVMGDQVTPLSNTCDSASTYFDNAEDNIIVISDELSSQRQQSASTSTATKSKKTINTTKMLRQRQSKKNIVNNAILKRNYYQKKIHSVDIETKNKLLEYKLTLKKHKLLDLEIKIKQLEYDNLRNKWS